MTITVFAVFSEGEMIFSGLHQNILVYRKETSLVESIPTDGMWIGLQLNFQSKQKDTSLKLEPGDSMLLFTDGITEAWQEDSVKGQRDSENQMFGEKRLIEVFQKHAPERPSKVIDEVIGSMKDYVVDDDVTLLVMKRID